MEQKISVFLKQQQIKYLTFDSRDIPSNQGNILFFAIKGTLENGNKYIKEVLEHPHVFVFTDDLSQADKKRVFYVENCRLALSIAAGCLYPKTPEYMLAVTGTNGKSSVVSYVLQLLGVLEAESISASIGTLGINSTKPINVSDLEKEQDNYTTSNPILLRKILHRLAEEGVKYVAMEISSHALEQKRLGNLEFDAVSMSSFSRDHLDYHITMEKYMVAKLRLFTLHLKEKGKAVVTNDIENIEYLDGLFKFCKIPYDVVTNENLPINNLAQDLLFINSNTSSLNGRKFHLQIGSKEYDTTAGIYGEYQLKNLLVASQMLKNIGFNFDKIIKHLPKISAPTGRLQKIDSQQYSIFIDYAHTEDALEKTLLEIKESTPEDGRLMAMFGCGGERDIGKRKMMGAAAAALSDLIIITDDNPRNEDSSKIRSDIIAGIPPDRNYKEIADRKKAIEFAISVMTNKDVLLIAGKGHENYQIIGNKKIHFSDFECATNALKKTEKA